MPTIYDVAKNAGVSITTVSRVLNNPESVRAKTRQRIEQAMKDLNYTPNPSARSLNLGISSIVALVVPDISNPFYSEMARGAQDACDERGYHLLICSSDGKAAKEFQIIQGLARQRVDGVCMVHYLTDEASLRLLAESALPAVIIGSKPKEFNFDSVGTFGTGNALREIVSQLINSRRQRLAHIAGPVNSIVGKVRRQQYLQILDRFNLVPDDGLIVESDFTIAGGKNAALKLLALPEPPDMIFSANDMMAIGVFQALEEAKLRIPEDMSFFGCDDIFLAGLLRPAITSIHLPKYELGRQAAELLFERISHPEEPLRQLSLEARPIVRTSTEF